MSAEEAQVTLACAFGQITSGDPQVYDVFWTEDDQPICVPWENLITRAIGLQRNEEGLWTNASPLPNGVPARAAKYAGCVYRGPFPPVRESA